MTTIAYKNGVIAYDSMLCQADEISDIDFNKKITRKGVHFFVAGWASATDELIDAYLNGGENICDNAFAIVCDKGEVFSVGVSKGELWRFKETKVCAIGSGSSYALGAMDAGCSAKEAVVIASNRDCFTGGKIKTHRINK